MVEAPAAEVVARADLQEGLLVEDVQTHQGGGSHPVHLDRVPCDGGVEPADASCPAGYRAELMASLADLVADLVEELGWHGSIADPRGVGLEDADGQVDPRRRNPAAGKGAAGGGVGAGDIWIGAEVEVEHRRLGALEKDVGAGVERVLDEREGVLDEGIELSGIAHVFGEHVFPLVELGQDRVLDLPDDEGQLLAHERLLLEVADAEADAPDLVGICRPDTAPGGPQAVVAAGFLLELVEQWVVAHDHVRALADDELLRLDPPLAQLRDLAQQHDGVDHDAVADDAGAVLVEDAGGHQLELELAMLGDDGVAGVVAALGADDHLGLRGEVVDDLAFALVAPLAADQDDDHYSVPGSGRLVSRL